MIWQVLGIPRTGDEGIIRRAYARRLKQIGGTDTAGFEELRQAYEAALGHARHGPAEEERPEEEGPAPAPDSHPDTPMEWVKTQVMEALESGRIDDALNLLNAGPVRMNLPLADQEALLAATRARMTGMPDLKGGDFIALAVRMEWDPDNLRHGPQANQDPVFAGRLAMEYWWAWVHELAALKAMGDDAPLVRAARILLGRSWTFRAYLRDLSDAMDALIPPDDDPAAGALDRLEPQRLDWCRNLAERRLPWVRRSLGVGVIIATAMTSAAYVACLALDAPLVLRLFAVIWLCAALSRIAMPRQWFYSLSIALVFLMFAASAPGADDQPAQRAILGTRDMVDEAPAVPPGPGSLLSPTGNF